MNKLRIFILSLLILIVAAPSSYGQKAKRAKTKDALVMSFNVCYFGDNERNEIKRWNRRKSGIITLVNEQKPVILGMQEIRKDPQLDYLDANLPDYARIGVGRDDGADGGDFSVIYYRKDFFDLIDTGDYWMSETPAVPSFGWGAGHRRITTWGHFRIKGTDKEILVYNTHLDHAVHKAREESIKMMRDSMMGRMTPDLTTVLAIGDFNADASNYIFEPFEGLLLNARDEAPLTNRGTTFNGWTTTPVRASLIDQIFYRNATPVRYDVITAPYDGIELMSDHYPIIAEFKIPLDQAKKKKRR